MERWAANTLRILGIILTSIIVVCGCLFLVLLGQCASQGGIGGSRNPGAGTNYFFGAVLLALAGITFIAVLARGIHRSSRISPPPPSTAEPASSSVSLSRLSPASRRAIDSLGWALAARLVASALQLAYSILQYRRMSRMPHNIVPVAVGSAALYALPVALLLYFLYRRISRAVLAFALGIPAAQIAMVLITSMPMLTSYLQRPVNLVTLMIPLALDVVIVVLAYQAEQRTGLKLPSSSLLTAIVVSFVYFYALHLVTQFVYRNLVRY